MENKYGTAKVAFGTPEEREVVITSFLQATYKDFRLTSVVQLEDGSFILLVENPGSSGRAIKATMWLSEESMIALHMTITLYLTKKGVNIEEKLKECVGKKKIEYRGSADIFTEETKNQ